MKKSAEFNWLGYCISCNIGCCHNFDKTIPENECIKPQVKMGDKQSYDNRPLECKLFPFDIREVDEKLVWVMWNNCHATPRLKYEKFMNFFEKNFSRTISLKDIQIYVAQRQSDVSQTTSTKGYVLIREVNWPNEV